MKLHIIECNSNLIFKELIPVLLNAEPKPSSGLINIKYDDYSFVATYYLELKRSEKSVDFQGKETLITFDYYIYQNFSFHLISDRLFLVVNEPNKHSKNLLEFILSVCRLKISFKTKKIDLNYFIKKGSNLSQFQVLKARFNELSLSKHSKGSLEITSTHNAIVDFKNVFGEVYYDLSKIKVSFFDEFIYNVELSKTGLICLSRHSENGMSASVKLIKLLFF